MTTKTPSLPPIVVTLLRQQIEAAGVFLGDPTEAPLGKPDGWPAARLAMREVLASLPARDKPAMPPQGTYGSFAVLFHHAGGAVRARRYVLSCAHAVAWAEGPGDRLTVGALLDRLDELLVALHPELRP